MTLLHPNGVLFAVVGDDGINHGKGLLRSTDLGKTCATSRGLRGVNSWTSSPTWTTPVWSVSMPGRSASTRSQPKTRITAGRPRAVVIAMPRGSRLMTSSPGTLPAPTGSISTRRRSRIISGTTSGTRPTCMPSKSSRPRRGSSSARGQGRRPGPRGLPLRPRYPLARTAESRGGGAPLAGAARTDREVRRPARRGRFLGAPRRVARQTDRQVSPRPPDRDAFRDHDPRRQDRLELRSQPEAVKYRSSASARPRPTSGSSTWGGSATFPGRANTASRSFTTRADTPRRRETCGTATSRAPSSRSSSASSHASVDPPAPSRQGAGGQDVQPGQRSQTRAPWRKQEMTPSSLTFRTGPNRLATRAAVVRAPSAVIRPGRDEASWRRIAPKAMRRPARSVTSAPSRPARASTIGGSSVDDVPSAGQVVEGPLRQRVVRGQLGGRAGRACRRRGRRGARSAGRSPSRGSARTTNRPPWRPRPGRATSGTGRGRAARCRPPAPRRRTSTPGRGSASGRARRRTPAPRPRTA